MKRFLLDTNMLVGFTRGAEWAHAAHLEYKLGDSSTMVYTSVICRAEMYALAEKFGWGEKKRQKLVEVLNDFPATDIHQESVLKAYAVIDTWTHGKPPTVPGFPPPPKPAVCMGQNDLWIAATAHVTGATLMTTDRDFDHLHESFLQRIYIEQKKGIS